jgi:hypothetical protein
MVPRQREIETAAKLVGPVEDATPKEVRARHHLRKRQDKFMQSYVIRRATQPSRTSDGKNLSSTVHISMKDDDEDESDSGDENDDNKDGSGEDEQFGEEVHIDKTQKKKRK